MGVWAVQWCVSYSICQRRSQMRLITSIFVRLLCKAKGGSTGPPAVLVSEFAPLVSLRLTSFAWRCGPPSRCFCFRRQLFVCPARRTADGKGSGAPRPRREGAFSLRLACTSAVCWPPAFPLATTPIVFSRAVRRRAGGFLLASPRRLVHRGRVFFYSRRKAVPHKAAHVRFVAQGTRVCFDLLLTSLLFSVDEFALAMRPRSAQAVPRPVHETKPTRKAPHPGQETKPDAEEAATTTRRQPMRAAPR